MKVQHMVAIEQFSLESNQNTPAGTTTKMHFPDTDLLLLEYVCVFAQAQFAEQLRQVRSFK